MIGHLGDDHFGPSLVHVRPSIFVGGIDDVTSKFLSTNKIEDVICVTYPQNNKYYEIIEDADITNLHILPFHDALPEYQPPYAVANAGRAVKALRGSMTHGRATIVHCQAGIHRSVGVVLAALTMEGVTPSISEAYERIRRARGIAQWYPELHGWIYECAKKATRNDHFHTPSPELTCVTNGGVVYEVCNCGATRVTRGKRIEPWHACHLCVL